MDRSNASPKLSSQQLSDSVLEKVAGAFKYDKNYVSNNVIDARGGSLTVMGYTATCDLNGKMTSFKPYRLSLWTKVRRSVSGTALPTSSFAFLAFFGFESVARLAWFTIAALVLLLIAAAVAGLRQGQERMCSHGMRRALHRVTRRYVIQEKRHL